MAKRKSPFQNLNLSEPSSVMGATLENPVQVKTKVTGRVGRPSPYKADEATSRLTVMLPDATIEQMKRFLLDSPFKTQGGLVNTALLEFMDKYKIVKS